MVALVAFKAAGGHPVTHHLGELGFSQVVLLDSKAAGGHPVAHHLGELGFSQVVLVDSKAAGGRPHQPVLRRSGAKAMLALADSRVAEDHQETLRSDLRAVLQEDSRAVDQHLSPVDHRLRLDPRTLILLGLQVLHPLLLKVVTPEDFRVVARPWGPQIPLPLAPRKVTKAGLTP